MAAPRSASPAVFAVLLLAGLAGAATTARPLPAAGVPDAPGSTSTTTLASTTTTTEVAEQSTESPGPPPGRLWGLGQAAGQKLGQTLGQALDALGASTPQRAPQHFPEDECSRAGGMCLTASECPVGLLAEPGLCPLQRAQGVECCHGVSVSDHRCGSHGGECMPSDQCAARLQYAAAEDCRKGEACCVLVGL